MCATHKMYYKVIRCTFDKILQQHHIFLKIIQTG